MTANTSGRTNLPNEIQNIPISSATLDASHIICGPINTQPTWNADDIHVKGNLIFESPYVIPPSNKIVATDQLCGIECLSSGIINGGGQQLNLTFNDINLNGTVTFNPLLPEPYRIISPDLTRSITCQNGVHIDVVGAVLHLNGNRISQIGDATFSQDAMNRQSSDARYYLNTRTLNSITAPTNQVSLNSQRITNLADWINSTDAMNRQSSDARYYLNTTPLNQIALPLGNVQLNGQKITGLQNAVFNQDAVTYAQLLSNGTLVGSMQMYCSSVVPAGYLECNGASISRTTYANLFTVIGTSFGTADINSFNLPETRGLFPRGWNHSSPNPAPYNDPDTLTRIASNVGGSVGDNIGTKQADQLDSHAHTFSGNYVQPTYITETIFSPLDTNRLYSNSSTNTTILGTTSSVGGNETRSVNFYVMFIIKY